MSELKKDDIYARIKVLQNELVVLKEMPVMFMRVAYSTPNGMLLMNPINPTKVRNLLIQEREHELKILHRTVWKIDDEIRGFLNYDKKIKES